MKKNETPKVFISYAWGSKEYQDGVLAFATSLVQDGIDVVLDKWDLTEGNDTYAFMEKSVKDSTITNVLILLDPLYTQKANDRSGGVGTETQIISPEVYNQVNQDKFLPIIMKRDSEGNVSKPTYLKGTLHFDLSIPDTYDNEYKRLVKKLYGEEVYKKPSLGSRPKWVDESIEVPSKTLVSYQTLTSQLPMSEKKIALENYLEEIKKECVDFAENNTQLKESDDSYLKMYDSANIIREKYLQLLKKASFVEDNCKKVAVFFEETLNAIVSNYASINSLGRDIVLIRLHEFFIYTVAFYLRARCYSAVGYILGKTYFDWSHPGRDNGATSFTVFHYGQQSSRLDQAIKERDKKQYYSGIAQHWVESIDIGFCTKEQFVLADLICYNYTVYSRTYTDLPWFPKTYVYDNRENSLLWKCARQFVSREYAIEFIRVFGFEIIEDFVERMKQVEEEYSKGHCREMRYSNEFWGAPVLSTFIKAKEIGTKQ